MMNRDLVTGNDLLKHYGLQSPRGPADPRVFSNPKDYDFGQTPEDFRKYLKGQGKNGEDFLKSEVGQRYINAYACKRGLVVDALKAQSTTDAKAPQTFLWTYEPDAFGYKGRAAIAIGNPDEANHVTICVPGTSKKVDNYMGSYGGKWVMTG